MLRGVLLPMERILLLFTLLEISIATASSQNNGATLSPMPPSATSWPPFPLNPPNTTPNAKILTGACTTPTFAYGNGDGALLPQEALIYPAVGCAYERQQCCPVTLPSTAWPATTPRPPYNGLPLITVYLSECPGDYIISTLRIIVEDQLKTLSSYYCCPTGGWKLNNVLINGIAACYSPINPALPTPAPTTVSFDGYPTYVIDRFIVSTVITNAYWYSPPPSSPVLSPGAIAGIVIGATATICIISGMIWLYIRKRRRAGLEINHTDNQQPLPEYPGIVLSTTPKPEVKPEELENEAPVRPISTLDPGIAVPTRKPVSSMNLNADERAEFEALRAEKREKQRVAELQGGDQGGGLYTDQVQII